MCLAKLLLSLSHVPYFKKIMGDISHANQWPVFMGLLLLPFWGGYLEKGSFWGNQRILMPQIK